MWRTVRNMRSVWGKRRVAHFSTNHERWVAQVWIFRPGKPQNPELERTRTRWLRFIVSHISKSRCGAPIFLHYWLGRLGPPVVNGQRWATRRQAEPVCLEAHRTADPEVG